jgi:hydroxymethylbilane synthase
MKIRIGTRGSQLALWQANLVKTKLESHGHESELVVIHTYGDKETVQPLHLLGGQGVFTKALDDALLSHEIDLAVHSCKDIPGSIHEDLVISSILKREDPQEVWLSLEDSIHLENTSRSFVIGTSSLRRIAFLKHYFGQHTIKDVRGNLDTRIEKLKKGEYDALVLAYAGIKRMGYEKYIRQKLSKEVFIPAVGQGAIAIMARKSDTYHQEVSNLINHEDSFLEVMCERYYLQTIQGGCKLPVFGYATKFMNKIRLLAGIASVDGKVIIKQEITGDIHHIQELGITLGNKILNEGGKELIYAYKN